MKVWISGNSSPWSSTSSLVGLGCRQSLRHRTGSFLLRREDCHIFLKFTTSPSADNLPAQVKLTHISSLKYLLGCAVPAQDTRDLERELRHCRLPSCVDGHGLPRTATDCHGLPWTATDRHSPLAKEQQSISGELTTSCGGKATPAFHLELQDSPSAAQEDVRHLVFSQQPTNLLINYTSNVGCPCVSDNNNVTPMCTASVTALDRGKNQAAHEKLENSLYSSTAGSAHLVLQLSLSLPIF
nr:uncharacterized protein LOC105869161 isoform X1 [Microcebus murinus]